MASITSSSLTVLPPECARNAALISARSSSCSSKSTRTVVAIASPSPHLRTCSEVECTALAVGISSRLRGNFIHCYHAPADGEMNRATSQKHLSRPLPRSFHLPRATPSPPGPQAEGPKSSESSAPAVASESTNVGPTAETSPLVRLAWYASEAFGKVAALVRERREEAPGGEVSKGVEEPLSREEAAELLRRDYDQSYFVTGAMTMDLYEPDCEFADPFVSFRGRDRFKQNVSNLGSFMEDVSLKILDWQEAEDVVTTKWRFSCVLALPWRPILAASGGTDHFFDKSSGRIIKHVERWDISPADGLRQLLKPNPKLRKQSPK